MRLLRRGRLERGDAMQIELINSVSSFLDTGHSYVIAIIVIFLITFAWHALMQR